MKQAVIVCVAFALSGCAVPGDSVVADLRTGCAQGRQPACEALPGAMEEAAQERSDRAEAFRSNFAAGMAANAANQQTTPAYEPIPPPRLPVQTTCQTYGQTTRCSSY